MDRDRLEEHLAKGLSLEQIGVLENRDPSTVGYWVQKHGLAANGREKYAPRGGLTREQLEPLVESGMTLREMSVEVDRNISTVRYWLRKFDLDHRNRRRGRPGAIARELVDEAIEHGRRTLVGVCPHHGEGVFVIENSGRARCRRCRTERVVEWRRRVKATLVAEAGGSCRLCGYKACLAALEFHHLDPSEKSFPLSRQGITRAMAELREEALKCVLLCANCHAEVEVGFTRL
jgi:hypothetical protein